MKPAEILYGPIGVVKLESIDENTVKVTCRNGITKELNSFTTTNAIGAKLSEWKVLGGNIQDVIPELSVDERELCISGMTPENWEEMTR